ncbi:MAG: sigma-70 family RNA polymerase sigma factor [Verrucomicrobiales bacterium]|nr:sigma-70 family RNA polymerase sigma factor [Verrucomicrobiales bacterium]
MHELDDHALLRQYAEQNSEAAFAALVTRHVDKVFSVALRHTRNVHAAEEITQAVFVILAKKSGRLGGKVILTGWLYETARLTALTFIRSEIRRTRREQEAHMQTALNENESEAWPNIAPLLDDALAGLSAADRHAVVLRYFDGKSLGEVGVALGASEDAAKKRVTRAVEKLRGWFTKRGVTLTATVLTAAISANSVQAAPPGLAATVTAAAAKGTLISATVTTLVKTTMKTMTWLKIKLAVGVSVTALIAGGAATIALAQSQPTVYSLLEKPPIIANATIEKEINLKTLPPGFPAGAQKQSFTFALDGEDYRMDFGGGMAGRFGDTTWQTIGGQLTKYNSQLNKADGESGGITAGGLVSRMTINLLTTSGITTANPKNITWSDGHRKMTFEGDEGKKYAVEFSEQNGLPVSATVSAIGSGGNAGLPDGIIAYRYDPHFLGGRFPVEITRYYGNTASPDAKAFTIRIKTLEISSSHLSATDLDPDMLIKTSNPNYMPLFYSNNVPYWTDAKGKVRKVLTVEENKNEIERIKASQKK